MSQVLLVQDDADAVLLFRRALDKSGLRLDLTVAGDGDAALQAMKRPFDLVLLDLHLPGRSGLEVLSALPVGSPPVVVLTGRASPSEVREAYRLGAKSVFEVPMDFSRLLSMLQDICRAYLQPQP